MDSTITHQHHQLKKNVPDLRAGDRVRVHQKITEGNKERIQVFEGLVIKTQHGNGINGTFVVRRISLGVGIEKCFPLHLPSIVKIEKVRSAKVRRAKLYYVRGLVGKSARRLKKEKEDAKVWEDVVVEEINPPADGEPEQEKIEQETTVAGEQQLAVGDQPSENKEKEKKKAEATEEMTENSDADEEPKESKEK
jgi:large subunit ribosomal protein L19